MDWLLSLIPGGGITAAIGGIVAALGLLFGLFKTVQKTGVDKQKAKEAEARAKNLEALKRAADAGIGIRPDDGGVLTDPRNRDR